ncbi:ATP-dependent DNA helicase RecG [Caldalkalibacillus thermarum TA2.A1]|uniref:ATP-dependent DNA helicase RecG n=1 Tax=Caldalkalibacillus thermarum (strain TA2.A1) TaxID=986075 RepID=F5L7T0_CALTT|nr:ATP-dependent DNA helicase RecG [Caldalkalibacillus thermarum]EGL82595.1 ATP-dependent DNA helicase RecG [Caldalkalibacillus thermarum TA2.A1]
MSKQDWAVYHALKQPVTTLKGVGEALAEDLSLLGIKTIEDLLFHFPYRYDDCRPKDLAEVGHEETVTVEGTVHSEPVLRFYGRNKARCSFKVLVGRYLITAVIFNRPYVKQQVKVGRSIRLTGKIDKHRLQLTVQHYQWSDTASNKGEETLLPVYSVTGKLKVAQLRKWMKAALRDYAAYIPEMIPQSLLTRYKLLPRPEALRKIHFPKDYEEGKQAKRRFIYEEFFLFQLKMQALRKRHREQVEGIPQHYDQQKVENFIRSLPFELTAAQRKALDQILHDLKSPFAMNRLLQGDVGSGKTVVAAISLYASISAGYQGAFMVPTEILAEQHYLSLKQFYRNENIQIALLTGSSTPKERREILAGLQLGTIDLVVGTHALIQKDVYFKNLGLIITDEQHRFGVEQRRQLRRKGAAPDVLLMTATPIPRTLAITAFGDLDVTVIDELPAGRKKVETYWVKEHMLDRVFRFMQNEIDQGRQAYVVCPLIEESDKLDVQNVIDFHAKLCKVFPQYRIGLLHGRLSSAEKEKTMRRFAQGEIQILVTTTVIEVGVDVPNATLMIIYDAERFGLSQLHQLRGRVGRGNHQSYCILIADPKTEAGIQRMHIMRSTHDGFEVAKKDLALRGPGDFFGTKQSGLPDFKVADMIRDYRALEVARKDAQALIQNPSFWTDEQFGLLRTYLEEQLGTGEKLLD